MQQDSHVPSIIVSLPGASDCDTAASAAHAAGALVFRHGVTRSTPSRPHDSSVQQPVLLGAQWWLNDGAKAQIEALKEHAFVEVISVEQAAAALEAGATRLVVCGAEGAGLVGHESTLVLVRRVLALANPQGALVWARGGIGPDSASACVAAGAHGVVLDSQLLAADDVPLSDAMAKRVARFNPADTQALGVQFGLRYRVFAQLATKPARKLAELASTPGMQRGDWLQAVAEVLAPNTHQADPKTEVVELGQDLALSASFVQRCGWRTVGAIVEGLAHKLAQDAKELIWPWGEGEGVASVNGTRFPLHQGPMAQVADVAGFANAVFEAGAMPWLALANMPAGVAEDTVKATFETMGDRPFGAGIIGLDANRYRDQHIEMLKRLRPAAVMVAAGTAEQAHDFQNAGLTTWLHTPTPGLLRAALEAGLRRFILEGSEAGGHVGQLGSLVLWQMGIDEVLRAVEQGVPAADISFVLAGGLGDSASSHAAAALVQPLVKLGVRCGQQCGTAYLMTHEAVESGAIKPAYQAEIAQAKQTVLMGETVRTPTRVLPTIAADRIFASELERDRSDAKLHDKKSAYEHDNLGGLRAAAKAQKIVAVDKVKGATFADLDDQEQSELGLYHAGEIAALLSETCSMADFHRTLVTPNRPIIRPSSAASTPASTVGTAPSGIASKPEGTASPAASVGQREAIAIVGVGAVLPDAPTADAFWDNLRRGHSAVAEIPKDRWDAELLWDPDKSAPDKTYSKIGAFVKNFDFDRKAFRIPPKVVQSLDFAQKMALEAGRQALDDAGASGDDFPAENCAVIIGNSQGGELRLETAFRTEIPGLRKNVETALQGLDLGDADKKAIVDRFVAEALNGRTPITEDTMAGELPNCIAGRMAGTFDLGGPNFIADAACASSLAAIHVAIRGLREHEYDAALVGGADNMMAPEPYVKFCKIGALSPDGSKPFDADANGFVMGEGAAMFVLMRESDARASGRRIYARILGSGASSDGRGKGITAPNPRGQVRALSRAYRDAGVDPKQVTMFEAHGTGTAVGDPVEVGSLVETVGATAHGASLGSVKSNIGHLKAGAGAAAILKTTLALAHRTLVPTLNVRTPNPKLPLADGNLRLQRETQPWEVPAGVARVAGVSAFGFGGTNVHVVLAEADGETAAWRSDDESAGAVDAQVVSAASVSAGKTASAPQGGTGGVNHDAVYGKLVALVCERTGYDADELEPDFELEADLGIDTVKQAEIMAAVREVYGMEADADFRLADYPTLAGLARYVVEQVGGDAPAVGDGGAIDPEAVYATLVDLVCERTGYDADELEPDFELEADLGIDTVKQAEIMAAVREVYGMEADADFRLADYPTLAGLARYVVERTGGASGSAGNAPSGPDREAIYGRLVELVCDRTGYDADELEPEFELEADLGIDTVKQAEIMAAVREVYGMEADADFRLADYPTLAGLADYVVERLGGSGGTRVASSVSSQPGNASPSTPSAARPANATLEGLLVVGADDNAGLIRATERVASDLRAQGLSALSAIDRPAAAARATRLAVAFEPSDGPEALAALLDKAVAAAKKGKGAKILANKGVYFGEGKHVGEVAFLFPGQGSQYLGMLADMATDFPQVQATFDEADAVMADILDRPLSSYIHPAGLTDDASKKRAFMALTQTEITQPAMLTADIALLRVLEILGFEPDVVAGHSLGEYAACVAAGVMDFETALTTVAARGTAMANVEPMDGDCGKMAAVAGPVEVVEAALKEVDGYVVCANKNCPSQTVIGGSSSAVEAAGKVLADKGLDVMFLPVSHAFHTRVVAAATTPLRAHLDRMSIAAPSRKILSNVTADYYPTDVTEIAELLSKQVAAPVEYIKEIERMYADGVRTFVEVGPKRAQAGFVSATLGAADSPHRAIFTNHPKLGGRVSLRRAVAQLVAAGLTAPPGPRQQPSKPRSPGVPLTPPTQRLETAEGDTAWSVPMPIVCTGTALGVPGTERLFDALDEAQLGDALFTSDRTLIGKLDDANVDRIIEQRITRLEKGADGTANFVPIERREQAVKLAGRIGVFDLVEDFGVDERVAKALDEASQLAVAAGLEALRHAGLPLVPKYRTTRSGKQIANGWSLPKSLADSTGVLFASGFKGLDAAFAAARQAATDPDYTFDPRLLLRMMGMGHARFAEIIGARGPNASIDLACASTTAAIAMAEDWIKAGRCDRVIVIGGDNVTSDTMMPWVGSGFLASGAASDASEPTEAALPFDVRRNGTILGAGAVALVVETAASADARGIIPLADLVVTHIANSAFHQTRLDVGHVAQCFERFISLAEERLSVDRADIAKQAVFVSHETFTPARGGSAAAEVESLRGAFKDAAEQVWISNVKGYTGHPMGAGLEDAVALLMLQRQQVLGIPHLEQPDPALGNLRYARNESADLDYALRFAAGFGSQMALTLWRRRATTTARIDSARHEAWLEAAAPELGAEPVLEIHKRVLHAKSSGKPARKRAERVSPSAAAANKVPKAPAASKAVTQGAPEASVSQEIVCQARAVTYSQAEHGPALRAAVAATFAGKSVALLGGTEVLRQAFAAGIEALSGRPLGDGGDGTPDGVIDLTAWDAEDAESATTAIITNAQSMSGVEFYSVVTASDGRCGAEDADAIGAAARGVAKSLGREWPDSRVVGIDVPRDQLDDALVARVLAEIAGPSGDREIGVTADYKTRVSLTPAKRATEAPRGAEARTWLVSGGARGITATVVEDLAKRKLGGRFVLLGRTALDSDLEALVILDPTEERARIKAELKAAGERVTPAVVNKHMAPILKRLEIAQTVLKLRETGAEIRYEVCDIGDASDVQRVVTALEADGGVHACIHGAGAEDSQRLADKSADTVAWCFGAKVGGIGHLVDALPKACQVLIGFGSISGHFGNAGQVDYAAANEAMAKTISAWGASAPDGIQRQALTVHWSAWADVGMATRGSVGTVLQSLGIQLMPPHLAAPIVGDLVCSGQAGEVVASAALGALDTPQAAGTMLGANGQPRPLEPAKDPALDDHRIDGVAVLPGVLGMELMAQHASAAGLVVGGFDDVRFEKPVKYHRDKQVPLAIERDDDGTATLWAARSLAGGRVSKDAHFVGKPVARLSESLEPVPGLGDRRLREGPDAEGIYEVFFHTGVFRVLENVPWIDGASIVALGRMPSTALAEGVGPETLLTDPLTREMGFQAAGLCAMAAFEQRYLPGAVERVEIVASAVPGEQVVVRAIDVTEDAHGDARKFDVDMVTDGGQVLQRLRGLTMVAAGPLPDGVRVETRESSFPMTDAMNVTSAAKLLEQLTASGATMSDLFHSSGVAAYARYRSPLRKAEWLAGRLSLKRLVRQWLLQVHGIARAWGQLLVVPDDNRAPHLVIEDGPTGVLPAISISHSAGEAVVALDPRGGARVGVDVEFIAERDASFTKTFSEAELALGDHADDRFLTQLWCIKEAASKVLGLGFALSFAEIEVTALTPRAQVTLHGRAAECSDSLGLGAFNVGVWGDDNSVIALASAATHLTISTQPASAAAHADAETSEGSPA